MDGQMAAETHLVEFIEPNVYANDSDMSTPSRAENALINLKGSTATPPRITRPSTNFAATNKYEKIKVQAYWKSFATTCTANWQTSVRQTPP